MEENEKKEKKNTKVKKYLTIAGILFIIFILLNLVGVPTAYDIVFSKPHNIDLNSNYNYDYNLYSSAHSREEITYSIGDYNLNGYAYLENETNNLVVTVHGIKDFADYLLEEDIYFLEHGYNVFSFDCSGCGKSEGSLNGFSQGLIDLDKTLDFLNTDERFKDFNKYLFGFSAGAYASCAVLQFDKPNVKGVAAISGYDDAKNLFFEKGKQYAGPLAYIGIPLVALKQQNTFKDYLDIKASVAIKHSNKKVFIANSVDDHTVNYDLSILKQLEEDSNIISLKVSGHSHSGILYSDNAIEYQKDMKGKSDVDRARFNELNSSLFEAILDYYSSC